MGFELDENESNLKELPNSEKEVFQTFQFVMLLLRRTEKVSLQFYSESFDNSNKINNSQLSTTMKIIQ